jgi:hypothetical protein
LVIKLLELLGLSGLSGLVGLSVSMGTLSVSI